MNEFVIMAGIHSVSRTWDGPSSLATPAQWKMAVVQGGLVVKKGTLLYGRRDPTGIICKCIARNTQELNRKQRGLISSQLIGVSNHYSFVVLNYHVSKGFGSFREGGGVGVH